MADSADEGCGDVMTTGSDGDQYNSDILKQILEAKNGEPNRFQSFWENDEQDVDEFTEEEIQNEPAKRILWAAENNMMDEVERLLVSDPALVHSVDKDGYTPLHRAAYNDHLEMAEISYVFVYVERDDKNSVIVVEAKDHLKQSFWNYRSCKACCMKLLVKGANPRARTEDGWHPLHSASRWNCWRVAELLLRAGAEVNARSHGGLTPLHLACSEHDSAAEVVGLLLAWPGVAVDVVSQAGQSPRDLAAQSQVLDGLFRVAAPSVNELYPPPPPPTAAAAAAAAVPDADAR